MVIIIFRVVVIFVVVVVTRFLTVFPFFCYSSNRDHTVQGVRRQVQRRPLRRDHVRGMQGLLPAVPVVRGQLSVSAQQELRGGPREPEPVPVLPAPEMSAAGHVP